MVFESVDPTVASRVRSPHPSRPSLLERTDAEIISALKAGDDLVFGALVDLWGGIMLRLALSHVGSRAVAEEVVQDAWLTVIRSLNRFEGRSALRTWVLGIVVNLARSSTRAERRAIAADPEGPSVDPARFLPAAHPRWPHHWATEPSPWRTPEDELLAGEARRLVLKAIDALPAAQREAIVLRDLEGLPAVDVCNILGVTDTHQRVLLHRARSRVRAALEQYLAARETT
jgi:RNA polymerase sigma-70 factor, ECF subfamily